MEAGMFIPELAKESAKRWPRMSQRAPYGKELLTLHKQEPELAQQRQNRISRLNKVASIEKARAFALEADTSPRSVRSQSDVIRSIGRERVIGTRDLLDVNFLELAVAMARAVGRLASDNEFGTGFL